MDDICFNGAADCPFVPLPDVDLFDGIDAGPGFVKEDHKPVFDLVSPPGPLD